jgi:hypothetical protein
LAKKIKIDSFLEFFISNLTDRFLINLWRPVLPVFTKINRFLNDISIHGARLLNFKMTKKAQCYKTLFHEKICCRSCHFHVAATVHTSKSRSTICRSWHFSWDTLAVFGFISPLFSREM